LKNYTFVNFQFQNSIHYENFSTPQALVLLINIEHFWDGDKELSDEIRQASQVDFANVSTTFKLLGCEIFEEGHNDLDFSVSPTYLQ
jgi:hypothetical protein